MGSIKDFFLLQKCLNSYFVAYVRYLPFDINPNLGFCFSFKDANSGRACKSVCLSTIPSCHKLGS